MATTFPVEVMTPEGPAYQGEIEMISTRTTIGTIGIKANHEPIMTMLEPTELRLYTSTESSNGGDIVRFAQGEGYLQMAKNHALLLVEEAIPVADLDVADLQAKLEEAQGRLAEIDSHDEGSAQHERALRDIKRWTRYLEVAENAS